MEETFDQVRAIVSPRVFAGAPLSTGVSGEHPRIPMILNNWSSRPESPSLGSLFFSQTAAGRSGCRTRSRGVLRNSKAS